MEQKTSLTATLDYVLRLSDGRGTTLAIPFPTVPFIASNAIAAWPFFLLGLGLLERVGVFVGLAYAWMLAFIGYWVLFYAALVELWQTLQSHVGAWVQ